MLSISQEKSGTDASVSQETFQIEGTRNGSGYFGQPTWDPTSKKEEREWIIPAEAKNWIVGVLRKRWKWSKKRALHEYAQANFQVWHLWGKSARGGVSPHYVWSDMQEQLLSDDQWGRYDPSRPMASYIEQCVYRRLESMVGGGASIKGGSKELRQEARKGIRSIKANGSLAGRNDQDEYALDMDERYAAVRGIGLHCQSPEEVLLRVEKTGEPVESRIGEVASAALRWIPTFAARYAGLSVHDYAEYREQNRRRLNPARNTAPIDPVRMEERHELIGSRKGSEIRGRDAEAGVDVFFSKTGIHELHAREIDPLIFKRKIMDLAVKWQGHRRKQPAKERAIQDLVGYLRQHKPRWIQPSPTEQIYLL